MRLRKRVATYPDGYRAYLIFERGRLPRTVENYVTSQQRVAAWVGGPVERVAFDDLRRFVRESGFAQSTVALGVASYRSLHTWAMFEELSWADFRVTKLPVPQVARGELPPLSIFEARKLLTGWHTPIEARVVYLGLYAGLRIEESTSVTDENWKRDRLIVIGKGRKKRSVPIHPELHRVKYEILAKQPKSKGVCHSAMGNVRKRTGAIDLEGNPAVSHALRRTFADLLYDRFGVPWEVVSACLGHKLPVTSRYARPSFTKMREAIERLDYYSGEPVQLALF